MMLNPGYNAKHNETEQGRAGLCFYIYNLHLLEQKNLQSPGNYISKRTRDPSKKTITKQTDRQLKNNWMCKFGGELWKLLDWETFINEQKG